MLFEDKEILGLFCKILNDRLIIMDDLEFKGERQSHGSKKFLSVPQIRTISSILNRVAYLIFKSEETMEFFDNFELTNIKEALMRLVNRD